MAETNRYVAKIEVYVYGKDDYHARMKAHKMLDKLNADNLNADGEITEMGSQPFGTMQYRNCLLYTSPSPRDP